MPISNLQEVVHAIASGRASEVIPALEQEVSRFPMGVTAQVLLARAYEAEQSWPKALSTWQWASTLMPNSPVVQEGLKHSIREATRSAADLQGSYPATVIPGQGATGGEDLIDLTAQPDMSPHFFREEEPLERPHTEAPAPVPVREHPAQAPARGVQIDDLDRLIVELESARITPDPDVTSIPAPDLDDDVDDMVSETLARIYAAQRQFDEAARVYELLAAQHPDRAKEFFALASEMRSRAAEE